jgi:two-component system response regulator HupR/HoxA
MAADPADTSQGSGELPARARLLVVDDEPLNRELMRRILSRTYDIQEAEDAEEALSLLEREATGIAAVVCDQLMPGRSGTDLASDVRSRWPRIRFVLITGYDDDPEVDRARAAGLLDQVMAKPWRGAALMESLAEVLRR